MLTRVSKYSSFSYQQLHVKKFDGKDRYNIMTFQFCIVTKLGYKLNIILQTNFISIFFVIDDPPIKTPFF